MHKDIVRAKLRELLLPLALGGVFMGLGIASKWTAAYGAVGLAVLYFGKLLHTCLYEKRPVGSPRRSGAAGCSAAGAACCS